MNRQRENELTPVEVNELEALESMIAAGLETFMEVGAALTRIREGKLYRARFGTFEDYCQERWGMTRQSANRMIAAAKTIKILEPIGSNLPTTESQARPLTRFEPDEQREIWQEAIATAPNGKVTAAHIELTAKRLQPDGSRGRVYHNGNLQNTIATCAVCGNLYDGVALAYCPYCAFTSDERIAYLRTGEQPRPPQPHVANNSGNNEWYTPPEYIEAARAVMGEIDTDPASSAIANETVQARIYFTEADNGLAQPWRGRVWMNPPYAQPAIGEFCTKLAAELAAGRVYEAITLTNNATETGWFRTLSAQCAAVCFPAGRIRFLDTSGAATGAPLQGQAVMYFGQNVSQFANEFGEFGQVFYAR